MRAWRQRPVSGEAEKVNAISGARTRRRCRRGSACVRDPRAEALGESEVFRDPLSEASDEAGRWAGLLICLAGGLARENVACLSSVDFFPLSGRGWVFFTLI
jgi:hypothetical protein